MKEMQTSCIDLRLEMASGLPLVLAFLRVWFQPWPWFCGAGTWVISLLLELQSAHCGQWPFFLCKTSRACVDTHK